MVHIYGIKNCGSVKKALNFFEAHTIAYTFHDFKSSPVPREIVQKWSESVGTSLLLNTKGTTYRTLDLKSLDLGDADKIDWMAKENRLIKRPVIEAVGKLIVGFDPHQYEGIFLT